MKAAVLVSGGVDSSVALFRAIAEYGAASVRAYYLKIWLEDELSFLGECPWEEDLRYARAVCDLAGVGTEVVPLEVVPLQNEYYDRVVSYTLAELRAGRTPSPDIFCNQRIKFGAFLDVVADSAEVVVTGHYARKVMVPGGELLRLAPDPIKDQTYFLSHLSQEQLRSARFPVGDLTKEEVRREAARLHLPNRFRPDSQGICFLGKIKYPDFVRAYLGERDGSIVERESGKELGRHTGVWFYTIGQRQGLGLGNGPWYVVEKDLAQNIVWVSHRNHVDERETTTFFVNELTWLLAPPGTEELRIKIRHGPDLIPSRVVRTGPDTLQVTMSRPDRGVSPGQFAVFYDGELCLGSGKIAGPAGAG